MFKEVYLSTWRFVSVYTQVFAHAHMQGYRKGVHMVSVEIYAHLKVDR